MATVKMNAERLDLELAVRGMKPEDLTVGENRVSTNILTKIRAGEGIRTDIVHRIRRKLDAHQVDPLLAELLGEAS